MFLCRRPLLHRLHISQSRFAQVTPHPFINGHLLSTFGPHSLYTHTSDSTPSTFAKAEDTGTRTWASVNTTLQEYMSSRPKGGFRVQRGTLFRLLTEAVTAKDKVAVGYVSTDILHLPADPERNRALRHLILNTEHRLLRPRTVRAILDALAWGGQLEKFTDYHLKTLAHRIAVERERTSFAGDFSTLLHSNIMARLKPLNRVPSGARSVAYELPDVVEAAFELLSYLLLLKSENQILDLFQALTEKLFIPPEAVQQAPTTSMDFNYIVSVTLARACLYWYKRGLAHRVLLRYLPSGVDLATVIRQKNVALYSPSPPPNEQSTEIQQSLDPQLLDLITETLYATLRSPNTSELELCVDVISRVHLLAPIPGGIIRLVYTAATECGSGNVARRLYAFTRERAIERDHHYPGPQGRALLFLMTFLTQEKGNSHFARTLANEVVENDTFLPVNDRPKFLTLVAGQSFGMAARTLWERYAVGKDSPSVVGNNALLTRMVRLFTKMARLIEADLPDHDEASVSCNMMGELQSGASVDTGLEVNHAETNNPKSISDASKRDTNRKPSVAELRERAENIRYFVQRVIEAFVMVHKPLAHAKHANLSSLARAYFVAGDFAKGFEVFRNLIRRREVPDLHDINIGLSALAEHNPRSAAKMVQVMIQRGIQPNSVTFGTVVHQALIHGDTQLVGDLLQLARQAGNIQLSPEGLYSLTRGSVSMEDGTGAKKSAHLKDALELLKSMPDKGRLSSPDMGKFMVFAALREDEPVVAFEFWRLLLKYSSEWDDREQIHIRRLLRRSISQNLGSEKSRSNMLNELWERPPYHAMK
ncbi:hypothetical protein GGU11DRAFT_771262 [Lentinula aff. detonsa]|nr:hypothetical protein GGU11DRAFT_771262 [Lentinula aff. detonsa]